MDGESQESKNWTAMCKLWQMLQAAKPTERNEMARRYAITMTEFEKVMGYYYCFVMQECDPGITHE